MSQPQPQATLQSSTANKPGRPPFLTDVKRAEICAVVAAGCSFRTAAKYVGCKVQAISALAQRDREFNAQLDRAVAQREIIPLSHIREASKHSWRAAAWLLEKTVGGRYGGDVKTLEEEAANEKSEDLSAFIAGTQRTCGEDYDEHVVPNANAPAQEKPTNVKPAAEQPAETPEVEEQSPSEEFQSSSIEEFLRTDVAADEARHVAALLACLSPEAEPNAAAANAKKSDNPPDSAATRRTPTAATTSPKTLTPGALLSESISPQSILESMQALEASWKRRGMEA